MNKKAVAENTYLLVSRHVSKKDNELSSSGKVAPISQNLTKTFNSNVYVKFIPIDVPEEEVKKVFSEVGKIISMRLDKSVRNIGGEDVTLYQYAYILYEKVEEAQTAIKKLDNSNRFGSKPLSVELWLSPEELKLERKQKDNREMHSLVNAFMQ